jgi:hypothetical protein
MNRPPLFAGRYYFPDEGRLRAGVMSFIEDATVIRAAGDLVALIVPHGPLMDMGPIAGHAYKMLLTTPLRWDMTTLLAPTQHEATQLLCDARDAYDTPMDALRIDRDAVNGLRAAGVAIADDEDDGPVIECHAPFVLSALGDVPALPLRVPLQCDVAAIKAHTAQFGFVIAAANLPAGNESSACDAIARLDVDFFAGASQPKRRGFSSLFAGKSVPLEKSADNAVFALALALAKSNCATRGAVLLHKGAYVAAALYR